MKDIITEFRLNIFFNYLSGSLFRNAYNLIIGTGITSLFGFIFWLLATKYYSSEAIGYGSALISAVAMLGIFGELGLGIALIRFLPENTANNEKSREMINTSISICIAFSFFIAIIFLSGLKIWSATLIAVFKDPLYWFLFILFTITCTIQPLILNIFLTKRMTRFIVLINLFTSILKITLIILLSFFINNVLGIYLAYGFSLLITLTTALFLLVPQAQPQYFPRITMKIEILHEIWAYAINNYIARVFLQITPLVIPIILITILGPVDTAYFFIGWSIASLLQIIPSSIFNSLLAECSTSNSDVHNNVRKSLQLMLLLLIPALLIIITFSKSILLIFGHIYSQNSYLILCVMAFSVLPWGICYLYISIERLKRDTRRIIYISSASFLLSLGLGSLLTYKIGLLGMGLGYLIGQSIIAIIVSYELWSLYYCKK
jgi:O-antigen/teichoic acid export membrane protein